MVIKKTGQNNGMEDFGLEPPHPWYADNRDKSCKHHQENSANIKEIFIRYGQK